MDILGRGHSRKNVIPSGADHSLSILNDIPVMAKSFVVYDNKILGAFRGDDTYPLPEGDELKQLRELKSLEAVVKEISPGKSVFSHMLVSPDDVVAIFGNDFRTELENIQKDVIGTCGCWLICKILGKGSFKKPFEAYSRLRPNRHGVSAFTLAGTVQSNPSALSPVAHSTERSQPDNEDEDDLVSLIQSLNHRAATLGVRVVQELFPPVTSRLQRNRHILLDPPMVGAENNYSFSSLQINISPLSQRNLSSLGYSGNTHTDIHDDPMSLTVLICVSNLMSGTYPGTFYLGETREWCETKPFSLLLFRGAGPHGGAQAIAPGDPDESEKRINLILYPRKEFVNRTVDIFYPWSPERVVDYSFFDDGAASFGSDE